MCPDGGCCRSDPANAPQHRGLWGLVPLRCGMLGYMAWPWPACRWHTLRQHYSTFRAAACAGCGVPACSRPLLVAMVLTWPPPVAWSNVATNLLMAAVLALGIETARAAPGARRRIDLAADDVRALARTVRNSMDRAGRAFAHSAATASQLLQPSPASSEAPPVPYQRPRSRQAAGARHRGGLQQAMGATSGTRVRPHPGATRAGLTISPHRLSQFLSAAPGAVVLRLCERPAH